MNEPISATEARRVCISIGIETESASNVDATSEGHYWDECDTCEETARLKRENVQLAHDLGTCMAEREELRTVLGKMLDIAHELQRIGALYGVD